MLVRIANLSSLPFDWVVDDSTEDLKLFKNKIVRVRMVTPSYRYKMEVGADARIFLNSKLVKVRKINKTKNPEYYL